MAVEREEDRIVREREEYNKAIAPQLLYVDRFLTFQGTIYHPTYTEPGHDQFGEQRGYQVSNYVFNKITARIKQLNDRTAAAAKLARDRQQRLNKMKADSSPGESNENLTMSVVQQMIQDALVQDRAKRNAEIMAQEAEDAKGSTTETDKKPVTGFVVKPAS
jgi:hypothetical protein